MVREDCHQIVMVGLVGWTIPYYISGVWDASNYEDSMSESALSVALATPIAEDSMSGAGEININTLLTSLRSRV